MPFSSPCLPAKANTLCVHCRACKESCVWQYGMHTNSEPLSSLPVPVCLQPHFVCGLQVSYESWQTQHGMQTNNHWTMSPSASSLQGNHANAKRSEVQADIKPFSSPPVCLIKQKTQKPGICITAEWRWVLSAACLLQSATQTNNDPFSSRSVCL